MTYEVYLGPRRAFPEEDRGSASSWPQALVSDMPEDLLTKSCDAPPTLQGNLFWSLKIGDGGLVRILKLFLKMELKRPPVQT